jgi:hypothetical protein
MMEVILSSAKSIILKLATHLIIILQSNVGIWLLNRHILQFEPHFVRSLTFGQLLGLSSSCNTNLSEIVHRLKEFQPTSLGVLENNAGYGEQSLVRKTLLRLEVINWGWPATRHAHFLQCADRVAWDLVIEWRNYLTGDVRYVRGSASWQGTVA